MPMMQKSSSASFTEQLKNDQRLQLAGVFFAGFLASYLLVALLVVHFYRQHTELSLQTYGSTIAQQLAQATADAVLRNDRVSLHAQLESLIDSPYVTEAAVYDMENHLLAQAVENRGDGGREYLFHYPATITFQDNIVGKVAIGLDAAALFRQGYWLYGYLLCGLLLCALASIGISHVLVARFRHRYRHLVDQVHAIQPHITAELADDEGSNTPPVDVLEKNLLYLQEYLQQLEQGAPVVKFTQTGKLSYQPPQGSYAELLIDCFNFSILQQQVHHRELQRVVDDLHTLVQEAAQLYHATDIHSPGDHIRLRFIHNDITDAALQSICCAVVIRNLVRAQQGDSSITLQLRFAIHWHEHDERPLPDLMRNHLLLQEQQELQQLCQLGNSGDILVSKGIKRSTVVAEHIKLELISGDSDVDFYRVQRLSDHYRKLLEQQALQLAGHIETTPATTP